MTFARMQSEAGARPLEQSSTKAASEDHASGILLKWATPLLLVYFGLRLIFFVLSISSYVPPDEVTHAGLCEVFSKHLLLPANSPESYRFGLVTNTPWLYYWIMGKLLHLNVTGLPDLVFLRLLNIPLAFGTVWYAMRLLGLLTGDRLARVLLLVALTNTAMFSLLSASVSYDNLANLLATMALYYTALFLSRGTGAALAASILCQLAGALTKNTLLPLVLALDLLLVVSAFRMRGELLASLREYLSSRGALWQLPLMVAALVLNLQLYGGNYLKYGALAPTMATVLSPDISLQNRIGARERIFSLYEGGKITYMDALQMAGEISHPGDKADTFYLLMNYENLRANPSLWLGPFAYAKVWLLSMVGTIFGIKAHLPMLKELPYLVPLFAVMGLALVGFLLRWRPGGSGWLAASLALVAGFYAGFLLVEVNYNAYQYYGTPGIALQGRYLFPVIAPIYALFSLYLLGLFKGEKARVALALATAALCLAYDFPWFLAHATPEWYSWLPS